MTRFNRMRPMRLSHQSPVLRSQRVGAFHLSLQNFVYHACFPNHANLNAKLIIIRASGVNSNERLDPAQNSVLNALPTNWDGLTLYFASISC